jgi:pyruvate dehydrogenase E2 component (dihydrolipoamide acetyltransferase)
MKIFPLPDLGEGLPEAEIVRWHVGVDDHVVADQPLVAVETAKAIVEIPSPRAGTIARLYGEPGDIIQTGDPLVEFTDGPAVDTGTVVGKVTSADEPAPAAAPTPVDTTTSPPTRRPAAATLGIRATPAVRALAQRHEVDLGIVTPSGRDGTILVSDVERAARILQQVGPLEPLRGVRRAMALNMARAHAEVAAVTVVDDADITTWDKDEEPTLRLIRAIVAACAAEPALNAWYDAHAVGRRVLEKIDLGIAVDTRDGLFVPVLRDIANRDRDDLIAGLKQLMADTRARTVPPEEMRGQTLTLSNFGALGGRYAGPIVVPPTVAIVGAGRARESAVVHDSEVVVGRLLPLSLTFDHRAVTGGEATRFLVALVADLERAA